MEEYIRRLVHCGWRTDNAWMLVNDLLRELDFNGLEEFVQREEATLCG